MKRLKTFSLGETRDDDKGLLWENDLLLKKVQKNMILQKTVLWGLWRFALLAETVFMMKPCWGFHTPDTFFFCAIHLHVENIFRTADDWLWV